MVGIAPPPPAALAAAARRGLFCLARVQRSSRARRPDADTGSTRPGPASSPVIGPACRGHAAPAGPVHRNSVHRSAPVPADGATMRRGLRHGARPARGGVLETPNRARTTTHGDRRYGTVGAGCGIMTRWPVCLVVRPLSGCADPISNTKEGRPMSIKDRWRKPREKLVFYGSGTDEPPDQIIMPEVFRLTMDTPSNQEEANTQGNSSES